MLIEAIVDRGYLDFELLYALDQRAASSSRAPSEMASRKNIVPAVRAALIMPQCRFYLARLVRGVGSAGDLGDQVPLPHPLPLLLAPPI
jgi:hypothetical protein